MHNQFYSCDKYGSSCGRLGYVANILKYFLFTTRLRTFVRDELLTPIAGRSMFLTPPRALCTPALPGVGLVTRVCRSSADTDCGQIPCSLPQALRAPALPGVELVAHHLSKQCIRTE
jgi:hypothetical protein